MISFIVPAHNEEAYLPRTLLAIHESARETGQPYEKVVADTERNFWMGADEALKYGLVSKIITNASDV